MWETQEDHASISAVGYLVWNRKNTKMGWLRTVGRGNTDLSFSCVSIAEVQSSRISG